MSRSFQVTQSIAATSTNNDVISAQGINAYFGKAASVTMYANGSATGLMMSAIADDGAEATGIVPSGSSVGVASTAGKVKTNEDFIAQFAIAAGFKLLVAVTNPTAGALTFNGLFVIT